MIYPWFIWIPRALLMLLILFMAAFSLDVFEIKAPLIQQLGGFFIHNIPVWILLLTLILTWKRPLIAGIVFGVVTLLFSLWLAIYVPKYLLTDLLAFSLPMGIGSALFILAHVFAERQKKTAP